MAIDLPGAVLFACSQNSVRSPMAESIMKHLYGTSVYVDSCGVFPGQRDDFVVEVLDEIGIDARRFNPKMFDDLEDDNFDLVITLSPPAHHRAMELTRTNALEVEYWPTPDPTQITGSRSQVLDGYRSVRDHLFKRIRSRFGGPLSAGG